MVMGWAPAEDYGSVGLALSARISWVSGPWCRCRMPAIFPSELARGGRACAGGQRRSSATPQPNLGGSSRQTKTPILCSTAAAIISSSWPPTKSFREKTARPPSTTPQIDGVAPAVRAWHPPGPHNLTIPEARRGGNAASSQACAYTANPAILRCGMRLNWSGSGPFLPVGTGCATRGSAENGGFAGLSPRATPPNPSSCAF
jgi:hypothetical protein